MRAVWFIGKFELLLNCTKYPNYSPKSRTPQQPQHVILDDIILSITYLTGFFLGESIFVLGSDNMNFRKNELLCLKSFNEELKDGITTIPQIKFQIEVTGTNDLTSPKVIALLSEEISKNLVYKRTILLLCQAHSEPHYVKATLYSVALETVTNLILELIEEKHKPIQNNVLAKQIRNDLSKTLDKYKSDLDSKAYDKFNNDITAVLRYAGSLVHWQI
jgi:pyridoxal/pyridoxine/pyridoxamine kinase